MRWRGALQGRSRGQRQYTPVLTQISHLSLRTHQFKQLIPARNRDDIHIIRQKSTSGQSAQNQGLGGGRNEPVQHESDKLSVARLREDRGQFPPYRPLLVSDALLQVSVAS